MLKQQDMPSHVRVSIPTLLTLACVGCLAMLGNPDAYAQTPAVDTALTQLQLPNDLRIERFADVSAYGMPRMMASDTHGNLFVTLVDTGRVLQLSPAGEIKVIAQGLNAPNGIAMLGDDLLVAEQTGVVKLTPLGSSWSAPAPFIRDLPAGGHSLKTVKVSPDGYVFVNVGSSCNVCIEENPMRATLLRYTAQGRPAGALLTLGRHAQSAIWAHGLRNSQGFAWHPQSGALFATNEGADDRSAVKGGQINDDLPPEHFNLIEAGKHYGWPACWADPANPSRMFQDPNVAAEAGACATAQPPAWQLPAHSTPIGVSFLQSSKLPKEYQQDAIVALHGSWNRKQPNGYALLRVQFRNQQPVASVPFVSGWLQESVAWGRPVDVIIGQDGWLYVSDDKTGWIYRIRNA